MLCLHAKAGTMGSMSLRGRVWVPQCGGQRSLPSVLFEAGAVWFVVLDKVLLCILVSIAVTKRQDGDNL